MFEDALFLVTMIFMCLFVCMVGGGRQAWDSRRGTWESALTVLPVAPRHTEALPVEGWRRSFARVGPGLRAFSYVYSAAVPVSEVTLCPCFTCVEMLPENSGVCHFTQQIIAIPVEETLVSQVNYSQMNPG